MSQIRVPKLEFSSITTKTLVENYLQKIMNCPWVIGVFTYGGFKLRESSDLDLLILVTNYNQVDHQFMRQLNQLSIFRHPPIIVNQKDFIALTKFSLVLGVKPPPYRGPSFRLLKGRKNQQFPIIKPDARHIIYSILEYTIGYYLMNRVNNRLWLKKIATHLSTHEKILQQELKAGAKLADVKSADANATNLNELDFYLRLDRIITLVSRLINSSGKADKNRPIQPSPVVTKFGCLIFTDRKLPVVLERILRCFRIFTLKLVAGKYLNTWLSNQTHFSQPTSAQISKRLHLLKSWASDLDRFQLISISHLSNSYWLAESVVPNKIMASVLTFLQCQLQ